MNKQEQIEEMAVIRCVRNPQAHTQEECGKCDFKQGMCNAYRHAENLYNAGYRKVPECAIILTKEEYDKLGLFEETVQEYKSDKGQPVLVKERKTLKKYPTDIVDFIRKETVKEFAEFLISQMKERDYMGVKYKQGVFSENEINYFVNQFLGEVEE